MALSNTNTTCDLYRAGHAPPEAPAVTGVAILLQGDFAAAHTAQVSNTTINRWTHVALFPPTADVRDAYPGFSSLGTGEETQPSATDTAYVPDRNGVAYSVIFVERIGRGTQGDCKRVYLQRNAPTWPTNDL